MSPPVPLLLVKEGRQLYGAEHATVRLLRELDRARFAPAALVLEYAAAPSEFLQALRALAVPCDVVRGSRELLGRLRQFVTAAPVPFVVCSIGYKCQILAHRACRGRGVFELAVLHGWVRTSLRLRFYTWLAQRLLYRFDGVLTVSPALARETRVANGHVACIGNGVDPDELERRASEGPALALPEAQPLILYAGRLAAEKGLFDLLEAYAPLKDQARLVLAGAGPLAGALRAEAQVLGLADTVLFAGHLDNPLPLLKRATLLVLPSYTEGTPLVILEAMALGTPVIAAAVGGIPDLLTDRHSGLLVPPRRPDLLQQALEHLLGHADLRDRLRQNALRHVQENCTQAAVARRFESAVLGWLAPPAPPDARST